MKEKYFVPFETAKQLEEKGYPQSFADSYYKCRTKEMLYNEFVPNKVVVNGGRDEYCVYYVAAPTYHEVIDWLEEKGIAVGTGKTRGEWYCSVDSDVADLTTDIYPTREEALNVAILKALELL